MRSPRPPFAGLALALALLATACASPSPGAAKQNAGSERTSTAPEPTKGTSEPQTPTMPEATPAPDEPGAEARRASWVGRDHRSAVACATDADCGWNDDCMPTRCVEASPPEACDESAPPPGTCACLEGACTLEPKVAPAPSGTCEPNACVVDRAAGKCVADDGGVPENLRFTKPVDVGPSCHCPRPDEGCVFQWFEPVPCESDRDCWVDSSTRRHPIARPKALRRRDFRPCVDGEAAPQCGPAGHCIVGPAFTC